MSALTPVPHAAPLLKRARLMKVVSFIVWYATCGEHGKHLSIATPTNICPRNAAKTNVMTHSFKKIKVRYPYNIRPTQLISVTEIHDAALMAAYAPFAWLTAFIRNSSTYNNFSCFSYQCAGHCSSRQLLSGTASPNLTLGVSSMHKRYLCPP